MKVDLSEVEIKEIKRLVELDLWNKEELGELNDLNNSLTYLKIFYGKESWEMDDYPSKLKLMQIAVKKTRLAEIKTLKGVLKKLK